MGWSEGGESSPGIGWNMLSGVGMNETARHRELSTHVCIIRNNCNLAMHAEANEV